MKRVRTILKKMDRLGLFNFNKIQFMKLKPKESFELSANLLKASIERGVVEYFTLDDEHYKKILSSSGSRRKFKLLNFFCLLKSFMYRRRATENVHSGHYEIAYPCFLTIKEHIGLNSASIPKYIKVLEDIDIIRCERLGDLKLKDGEKTLSYKSGVNLYCMYKEDWQYELNGGKKYLMHQYKEKGWKCVDANERNIASIKKKSKWSNK